MMSKTWLAVLWVAAAGLAGCGGGSGGGDLLGLTSPKGDYSILLMGFTGETHVTASEQILESIRTHTGWNNVFLVHKDNYSEIYWGRYRTPGAADKDLQAARNYVAQRTGLRPFQRARIVSATGGQVGPPEWDIRNSKGHYTVLVADYYDVPEADYVGRRKFAVDRCKELRDQGFEAYYYHDPSHSYVLVGSFPREAVKVIMIKAYDRSVDPLMPLVAVGQPGIQVLDPKMAEIIAKVPFTVNGYDLPVSVRDPKTGQWKKEREPPRVVPVPGRREEPATQPAEGGRANP